MRNVIDDGGSNGRRRRQRPMSNTLVSADAIDRRNRVNYMNRDVFRVKCRDSQPGCPIFEQSRHLLRQLTQLTASMASKGTFPTFLTTIVAIQPEKG
jgi:hypothetical protein